MEVRQKQDPRPRPRQRVPSALRESEERYRQLVELSPDGILIQSGGYVCFANQGLADLLHARDPGELIGMLVMDLVHPDSRSAVGQRIKQLRNGAASQPWSEQKLVRKDGSPVEVEAAARPFTWKGHQAIQVILRDITHRKQTDKERDQLFRQVENARATLRGNSTITSARNLPP
jgi:PAS domain S-box-containing protein